MKFPLLLALMIALSVLPSCKPFDRLVGVHQFDTIAFDLTSPPPDSADPVPHVWLDTNMEVDGLIGGGTVKSKKPYHIRIDYTDNTSSFTNLDVTRVKVVYDDGDIEDSIEGLTLPHRIRARDYEMVNSIAGGRTVKTTVNLLSGTLRGIITRDTPLTLEMDGFFTTKAGVKHPFEIDYHYTVRIDKGTRPLEDR